MARRYYSSTAAATTLSSGISSGTTSITVGSTSGFPTSYPFTLILDEGTASEEVVSATNVSGTTVTVTRGVDGTSAVSHLSGAGVKHGVSARDFDEPNAHVNTGSGAHSLDASLWTGTFGAWASWTPTWANMTIGNATVTAKYAQIGKTVHWRVRVTVGSTTSFTSTNGTFTLPTTAAAASSGVGTLEALSVGLRVECSTATGAAFYTAADEGFLRAAGAPPAGYSFNLCGTFEAA